jgi:hypothetical protein
LRDRNQKEVLAFSEGLVSALYQSLVSFPENTLERKLPSAAVLLSQIQTDDQALVTLRIRGVEVVEQFSALADEFQECEP